MVLKSYAKINLTLEVVKKLRNGLHDIQSIFCLIDLSDKIIIKKNKKTNLDKISIRGPYSKYVNNSNNSVLKVLSLLRKHKLISDFYTIKIIKKIPVFAGLGGGTSNAASVLKFLINNQIRKKKLEDIIKKVGTDLRLFFYDQGYLQNLKKVTKFKKKHKLYFLLVYPNIKCVTKDIYSKVRNYSNKRILSNAVLKRRKNFISKLVNSRNDLQLIVEKKYPIIRRLLKDLSNIDGSHLSRMSGSGSACYGLFDRENSSKTALKKLRKKYPQYSFSIAKTI